MNTDRVPQGSGAGSSAPVEHGLSAAEVADRVARGLVNRSPRSDWADYRAIIGRNVLTLFNALVVPAAIALLLLDDLRAATAVSGFAIINSVLGLAQEIRAKRHLDRLAILVETRARVYRDGVIATILASEVVLDDHVLLRSGDPVVTDGKVLTANFLEVDEALLTGESDPVPRHGGDRLLSGSFCVAGEGIYVATRVGREAFAQQTSAQARRYQYTTSPLQRTVNWLITILTATALALCLFYLLLHLAAAGEADELWRRIAATLTSMVPQGLVLMATLAFTLGAVRLSRQGAIVQRLSAVESMAAVDVLCMDKTGTLTTNQLTLDRLHVLNETDEVVRRQLRNFAWHTVDARSKSIEALRSALGAIPPEEQSEVLDQIPFKSQNRYSVVRLRSGSADLILALGAVEALRPYLDPAAVASVETVWRDLLPTGLRLLLFADAATEERPLQGSLLGISLRPLGLLALSDELRPDAGNILEALAAQGLHFKVLSGDNPVTVRATVGHLRLPLAREAVVTGEELAAATDPGALLRDRSVFGRVAPEQKLRVVQALQAQGLHVAMIGDGINDILPIKTADLGIAMGEGSSATKTVAGLVLENNRFALLPAALDEGRTIVRNLRRAAKLFLLKNVYTLLLIVGALGLFHLPFPYLPQQVTLLNVLTIGGPAFLIMLGRHPAGSPVRRGFLGEVSWFAGLTGLVMGVAGLFVLHWSMRTEKDEATGRTLLLSTLVILGLGTVLRLLAHRSGQAAQGDRRVLLWTALAFPVYLAVMYTPPIGYWADGTPLSAAHFFELTELSWGQWGIVVATAIPALSACLVTDWVKSRWD